MDIYFFDLCLFAIFYLSLFPLFIPGFLRGGTADVCVCIKSKSAGSELFDAKKMCFYGYLSVHNR